MCYYPALYLQCTSFSRIAESISKTETEIDFKNTKKLPNYTNQSVALYRYSIEIKTNEDACNTQQDAHIDEKWVYIMREQDAQRRRGREEGSRS